MGLLSWLFKEPEAVVFPPDRQEQVRTVIYLRSSKVPAQHWEDVVLYDAWGQPYTKNYGLGRHGASFGEVVLRPDGTTGETWIYGTEWKHKSGPPVTFGLVPADLFSQPSESPQPSNDATTETPHIDQCEGCGGGDKVPAKGYWICPVCDAEWNDAAEEGGSSSISNPNQQGETQ